MSDHVVDYLAEAIAVIKARCDVVINCTTGGTAHKMDQDWLYRKIAKEADISNSSQSRLLMISSM